MLDFGLAKSAGHDSISRPGDLTGTTQYMSPEQTLAKRAPVDHRTDVFSLGVILYEMLTGRRPYTLGGSLADVIDTICHSQPELPSRLNGTIDPDMEAIVMKALERHPQDRYQSAGAMLEDIAHYLAGEPVNARRHHRWYVARKSIGRLKLVVIGTVAAAFLVGVAAGIMLPM